MRCSWKLVLIILPAKQLYRQFGFKVYGIRKRYYRNGEDAFILRKDVEYETSQHSTN